jgi:DNA polymerase-1
MFLAAPGYTTGAADYDAMEVCTYSQLAGSGVLESLILNHKDMHCYTAVKLMKLFGIETTYEEVFSKTKIEGQEDKLFVKWRGDSKINNFQGFYGSTKYGLSKFFNISLEDGEKYLNAFYEAYPEVKIYMDKYREHAKKFGYVKTLLGRKRRLPELTYVGRDSFKNKDSSFDMGNLLNAAVNAPSQGSSGQTTLIAMTNIHREFKQKNMKSRIMINVHDEIVFELWIPEIEQASSIIKKWMEHPYYVNNGDCKVTLSADLKYGEIWKYGYTKSYWDNHPEEWQQCLSVLEKRNEALKKL